MKAIVALGVASNILQFLQFGTAFVAKAWSIYTSGGNAVQDLRTAVDNLKGILKHLQQPNEGLSDHKDGIFKLSNECSKTVAQLVATLDAIGLYDTQRKRDAIVVAFKTTWDSTKINQLQQNISEMREQLVLNLLLSLRFVFHFFHILSCHETSIELY